MDKLTEKITVVTTANVRPEVAIVVKNGTVAYDGEAAHIPPAALTGGLILMLMHPHTKDRMDALIKRGQKAAADLAKKEARRAAH